MPHTITIEPWDVWSHAAFGPIATIIYALEKVHRDGTAIGDPKAGSFGEWSEFHREDTPIPPGDMCEYITGLEGSEDGRRWYLNELTHILTLAGWTPERAADIVHDAYDRVNFNLPLED